MYRDSLPQISQYRPSSGEPFQFRIAPATRPVSTPCRRQSLASPPGRAHVVALSIRTCRNVAYGAPPAIARTQQRAPWPAGAWALARWSGGEATSAGAVPPWPLASGLAPKPFAKQPCEDNDGGDDDGKVTVRLKAIEAEFEGIHEGQGCRSGWNTDDSAGTEVPKRSRNHEKTRSIFCDADWSFENRLFVGERGIVPAEPPRSDCSSGHAL